MAMSVKYSNLGGTLDNVALVKKLFDTVLERFINVIVGIEQFYDLNKLPFEEDVGRLKAFEERTKRGGGGVRGQLLLTQSEWEARQKKLVGEVSGGGRSQDTGGRGRGRGRGGQADAAKESTGKRDKSHIKCFKCHKYDHYANRCPGEKEEEAHHARAVETEPSVLLMETETPELHFTGEEEPTNNVWYLDNGSSNHMTGDRLKFRDIDQAVSGKLKSNLISFRKLTEIGHRNVMDDDEIVVSEKDPCRLIMRVQRTVNRLYKIELAMKKLVDKEMVRGVPLIQHSDQVYMLKIKDQAVEAFVKYKAKVENSSGQHIKILSGAGTIQVEIYSLFGWLGWIVDYLLLTDLIENWINGGNKGEDEVQGYLQLLKGPCLV
ncbi:uncharacterized protein [Miscanthus floridulus]|uniref:uncharacterized protein n=1 Tax=Miscanthus floridulus TaxID=154761 RepID=UPI00345B0D3F